MTNITTDVNDTFNSADYVDVMTDDSLVLTVSVISCFTIYLVFVCFVISAMLKTKRIPDMARFLSLTLLQFYAVMAFIAATRRIIDYNNKEVVILTVLGVGIRMVSYTNIAMLLLDRTVVIQFPFFYSRYCQSKSWKIKAIAVCIWCMVFVGFVSGMILSCDLTSSSDQYIKVTCFRKFSPPFVGPILGTTIPVTCVCLSIIAKIVYQQSSINKTKNVFRLYRTTFVISANGISFLVNVILYAISVVSIDSLQSLLIIYDVLVCFGAITDTFIFALFFKECRLELLKIASICLPKLNNRVEDLRYEIFNIHMSDNIIRRPV